jgi:hypothetical protein
MPLDTWLALQNVVLGLQRVDMQRWQKVVLSFIDLGYRAPAQILPPRLEYEPIFSIPTKMQKPHSLKGQCYKLESEKLKYCNLEMNEQLLDKHTISINTLLCVVCCVCLWCLPLCCPAVTYSSAVLLSHTRPLLVTMAFFRLPFPPALVAALGAH